MHRLLVALLTLALSAAPALAQWTGCTPWHVISADANNVIRMPITPFGWHCVTLTANSTLACPKSGLLPGQDFRLWVFQDPAGNHTLTPDPTCYLYPGGGGTGQFSLTPAAGGLIYILPCFSDPPDSPTPMMCLFSVPAQRQGAE